MGILGGSFDPPHQGHTDLAKVALKLKLADRIFVIPCSDHPFHKSLSPFSNRFNMCQAAFKNENVCVVNIEDKLPKPSYTIQTIEWLHEARPDLNLKLLMGSDLLPKLPTWERIDDLKNICKLTVFKRTGFKLHQKDQSLHYVEGIALPDFQSRVIRNGLKKQPDLAQKGLDHEVHKQCSSLYA